MLASFKKEDKCFSFVSLEPVYPDLTDSTYVLKVYASWINEMFCYDAIGLIIKRMHKTVLKQYRDWVSSVVIYQNENDIMPHCQGAIEIENKIGMEEECV